MPSLSEVLTRFYLQEQSQEEICRDLNITETQFRLLKSKAKARLVKLVDEKETLMDLVELASLEQLVQSTNLLPPVTRILPVAAHAVAVFGDEQKASHWLTTPLPFLGDRSPAQVLEEQGGIESVEQILTRIEHNIPS